jgi:hypothetical protein
MPKLWRMPILLVAVSCGTAPPAGPDLAFHDGWFPLGTRAAHAAAACAECHPGGPDAGVAGLDCTTCHTEASLAPGHATVAGYAWRSPRCYQCHPSIRALDGGGP